jgi:DNA-binding SARP family transcriptional activator
MNEDESLGMLRRALNDLRAGLQGSEEYIISTRIEIRWNTSASYWLDVEVFESEAQKTDADSILLATDLYTGDLLRDMDEEWLIPEREHYRFMQMDGLRKLSAHYQALHDYSTALEFTRRALLLNPLSEVVYQDRIRLLSLAGDRAAALAEYERLQSLLAREFGVDPTDETQALVGSISRGESLNDVKNTFSVTPSVFQIPPELIGRENETDRLLELWENASRGQGNLAIVSGEAGVGKSHLVRNLTYQISHRGGLPLIGHCYEFENTLPYQPILDSLRPAAHLIRNLDLTPSHRSTLAGLLPELFEKNELPNAALSPDDLRAQLFETLLRCYILLSKSQPVLLVFEDTHWASRSALDWLTFITPRLMGNRIMVLTTCRTDEINTQHALSRLVRRFERDYIVNSIPLKRLSREANREWIVHLSGIDKSKANILADRLFDETAGNPFFLQEIVRGMMETGQIRVEQGKWSGNFVQGAGQAHVPLPDSLRETILARMGRLSELSRTFLQAAAIAGRTFQFALVLLAGGWTDELALTALDELRERGFLLEGDIPGTFMFTHHLVQEAIYTELTMPRRIFWHRKLAEAFQNARSDDFESIAHHFVAAGNRELGIEYSLKAAKRDESLYAYEDASLHLRAALDLMTGEEQPEIRMTILESLADNYRLTRDSLKAITAYQESLDLFETAGLADKMIAVRLYRKIFQTVAGMWENSGVENAGTALQISGVLHPRVQQLLGTLINESPHMELVNLYRILAIHTLIFYHQERNEMAVQYAQSAVELAKKLEAPVVLSSAIATLASVYGAHGLLRERMEMTLQALNLGLDSKIDDPQERIHVLIGAGSALAGVGEYFRAVAYLEEAESIARQIRAVHDQIRALSVLHMCWFRLDRWDEMFKTEDARRSLQELYPSQRVGAPCFAIGLSSAVHALRGNFEKSRELQEESFSIMFSASGQPENWKRSHRY